MAAGLDRQRVHACSNDEHRGFLRYVSGQFFFSPDYQMRKYTFLTLLLYGLLGSVFIDCDHYFIVWANQVRPFHLVILLAFWGMYFCYNTYYVGWFFYNRVKE